MRLSLRARFTEYKLSNYALEGGGSRFLQNFGTHPPDRGHPIVLKVQY